MPKTRRLAPRITKTGVEVTTKKCRKCMQEKAAVNFYEATDTFFDADGKFSVCKPCVNESFDTFLESEKSIEKALLRLCRALNLKYDEDALQATLTHMETIKEKEKIPPHFMGLYKLKLTTMSQTPLDQKKSLDLTYHDVTTVTINNPVNNIETFNSDEIDRDVILFWGEGFETSDYEWLERTLDSWKATHKCDTMGEQTLLREIVFKQFEIEKARKDPSKSSGILVKELQDLMKTASVDPSKANVASAGKSQETFSAFIKMIEDNEPAEYYQDKELFKDYDNIKRYFIDYLVRPLKNFITGSRDFSLSSNDEVEEFEDGITLEEMADLNQNDIDTVSPLEEV